MYCRAQNSDATDPKPKQIEEEEKLTLDLWDDWLDGSDRLNNEVWMLLCEFDCVLRKTFLKMFALFITLQQLH